MKVTWLFGGFCLVSLVSCAGSSSSGPKLSRAQLEEQAEAQAHENAEARREGRAPKKIAYAEPEPEPVEEEVEEEEASAEEEEEEVAEAPPPPPSRRKRAETPPPEEAQEEVVDPLQLTARRIEQDKKQGASAPRASSAVTDKRGARQDKKVAVSGIEGTLSEFDVKVVMDKKARAFAACHESRVRKVPALGGSVEFGIHVLPSGEVSSVLVRVSDLGDRVVERCLSEVIKETKFPQPHGGEADVKWTMNLEAGRKAKRMEKWETEKVEGVLKKNRNALLDTCDAKFVPSLVVTAYVARDGRVVAAGVATTTPHAQAVKVTSPETFDCIAEELRSWTMPKPKKRLAKVSFPIRTGA